MAVFVYRVCPAIGIARVGDSDDYFIGPETLADLHENPKEYAKPPLAGRVYRDNSAAPGKILRQAVRFRVYEFEYPSAAATRPTAVREATADKFDIRWELAVANKKSFPVGASRSDSNRTFTLPVEIQIAPGVTLPHTIDRPISGPTSVSVQVMKLIPDAQGRLVVVAGNGARGHVHATESAARSALGPTSAGWWDDLGDGPVRASIRKKGSGGAFQVAESAWLVLAQPAFSGPTRHVISLYDRLFNLFWMKKGFASASRAGIRSKTFSFLRDVYPVLQRTSLSSWVSNNAMVFHGPGRVADYADASRLDLLGRTSGAASKTQRKRVLDRLRAPGVVAPPGSPMRMPPGAVPGVTEYQYRAFQGWVDEKDFSLDWPGAPRAPSAEELPGEHTQAQLATASGGGFAPGIEIGSIVLDPSVWFGLPAAPLKFASWDDAFRLDQSKVAPGDLTKSLTVPWQVDMLTMCIGALQTAALPHGIEPNWPGARPLEVVSAKDDKMHTWGMLADGRISANSAVDEWMKLGFLRKVTGSAGAVRYLDDERIAPYP